MSPLDVAPGELVVTEPSGATVIPSSAFASAAWTGSMRYELPGRASPSELSAQETEPQEDEPQEDEPQEDEPQDASRRAALPQLLASNTGVGPPVGSGMRKRSSARF